MVAEILRNEEMCEFEGEPYDEMTAAIGWRRIFQE